MGIKTDWEMKIFNKKDFSIYKIRGCDIPHVETSRSIVAKSLDGVILNSMYGDNGNVPCLCPYCYSKLKSVPSLDYVPNKRRKDFYYTSDGFCIVSQKFKDFCDAGRYVRLNFQKLNTCDFYFFEPDEIFKTNIRWIPFNKFKYWCNVCKNYAELTGGVLKEETFKLETNDFIMRTDHFFGKYESKHPIIVVGLETERKMKDFGLKGIDFGNVYG